MTSLARFQVPAGDGAGSGGTRTHVELFDFADLRFIKSSRMSKRWLVFALRIKVRATLGIWCSKCNGEPGSGPWPKTLASLGF